MTNADANASVSAERIDSLSNASSQLVAACHSHNRRLVLAESCTGGLVASLLTDVAGCSAVLSGSFVVYQNQSKIGWLSVDADVIASQTAVCDDVAAAMATGALAKTPHADLAASITGHLGPDAPPQQDGWVHIGIADRNGCQTHRIRLSENDRASRKREAAGHVLRLLSQAIENNADGRTNG